MLAAAIEKRTPKAARSSPRRTLVALLQQQQSKSASGAVEYADFARLFSQLVPGHGLQARELRAYFERSSRVQPGVPPVRAIDVTEFAAALFPAEAPPAAAAAPAPTHRVAQAWERPAAAATPSSRRPASASAASVSALAPPPNIEQRVAVAIAEVQRALDDAIATRGPTLPSTERLTMNLRQSHAAERQLALLRRLRAIEPRAASVSEGCISDALCALLSGASSGGGGRGTGGHGCSGGGHSGTGGRSGGGGGGGGGGRSLISPEVVRELRRRATGGAIERLLEVLCPVPLVRGSIEAANGAVAAEADAAAAGDGATGGGAPMQMLNGPFDRGSGRPGDQRRGARLVRAPTELPGLIKYRHCRTPLLVPQGFDPSLVTRSAQMPRWRLRRRRVLGYNGLGKQ